MNNINFFLMFVVLVYTAAHGFYQSISATCQFYAIGQSSKSPAFLDYYQKLKRVGNLGRNEITLLSNSVENKIIFLVGTAHVSQASADIVQNAIEGCILQ